MKLLPILLLAFIISLGLACSSEPAVSPTATPDVLTHSANEAVGLLVQGMLRRHPDKPCSSRYARLSIPVTTKGYGIEPEADYLGEGIWRLTVTGINGVWMQWRVYEGSNAVETVVGDC